MKNTTKRFAGVIIVIVLVAAMFAAPAAQAYNPYVGTWYSEPDYAGATLEIRSDGWAGLYYPNDPSSGYYYQYVYGNNGEILLYDLGNDFVDGFSMISYDELVSYNGVYFYRG